MLSRLAWFGFHTSRMRWLSVIGLVGLLGCEGFIDGSLAGPVVPVTPGSRSPTSPGDPNPPPEELEPEEPTEEERCAGAGLGPSSVPMRQLTPWEYRNAVATLLPSVSLPATQPLDDIDARLTFDNLASAQGMTAGRVDQFLAAAERLAADAVADVARLTGCAAADAMCRERWALAFAARAYRRPLTAAETTRYSTFLRATTPPLDATGALEAFLAVVLQSPHFLFKPESGAPAAAVNGVIPLDGFERATRLAFFLTGTVPDAELTRAAAAGELMTPTQVEAQARRLLQTAGARTAMRHFHDGWLHASQLERVAPSASGFPEVRPGDRASYQASYRAFVDHLFWNTPARVQDYFLDDGVFVDARLASLLALPAPPGAALERRSSADRRGVLTQPWFLASLSHPEFTAPVLRGVHVLDRFLCKPVGAPPPGVNNSPPAADVRLPNTTRNRYWQHANDSTCAACHQQIDGIGFGLEGYDVLGRRRTTENGHPIDDRGVVQSGTDVDGAFTGALELASKLAQSANTERCFASHWYEYALAGEAKEAGACSEVVLAKLLKDAGGAREFVVRLVTSPAFLTRAPGEAP